MTGLVAPRSGGYCCVCKHPGGSSISVDERCRVMVNQGLLIPPEDRVCPNHLIDGQLKPDAIRVLKYSSYQKTVRISAHEASRCLSAMMSCTTLPLDSLTGLIPHHLQTLLDLMPDESSLTGLRMLLVKLKHGLPDSALEAIFKTNERRVNDMVNVTAAVLMAVLVPQFLGLGHLTREGIIAHYTKSAHKLLDARPSSVILVIDATYIYTQQAQDHDAQKKMWSMNKSRNLVKPTMIVTPDCYIVEVTDAFFTDSKNNDASILKCHMQSDPKWKELLQPGDILIMDRGYRDAKEFVSSIDVEPVMPSFLNRSDKQLQCLAANKSRCVTRIRFVVERVNKLWREWKFFANVVHNKNYHHMNDWCKIVCAILNMTNRSTWIESDAHFATSCLIKDKTLVFNHLQRNLEEIGLDVKANFVQVDGTKGHFQFPRMDLDDIEVTIALGSFTIEKAKKYIVRHLRESAAGDNGTGFKMFAFKKNQPDVHYLKARVHSKMRSAEYHNIWIQYDPSGIDASAIDGWYCECQGGDRTSSSCSHVAAIVCFLGYCRHHMHQLKACQPYSDTFRDARGGQPLLTTSSRQASMTTTEVTMEADD